MNWKTGDKAIICVPYGYYTKYNGEIACITSSPYYDFDRMLTIVDIEPLASDAQNANVACLRPVDDGRQVASWEDCVWQPKILEFS